jgi:hypothetical protein
MLTGNWSQHGKVYWKATPGTLAAACQWAYMSRPPALASTADSDDQQQIRAAQPNHSIITLMGQQFYNPTFSLWLI